MRALTVTPLQAGSARVEELPDPELGAGDLVVRALAAADADWLRWLITKQVPLAEAPALFGAEPADDVKVVITLEESVGAPG